MSLLPFMQLAQQIRNSAGRSAIYDRADQDFIADVMRHLYQSNAQLFQDIWVLHELGFKRSGYFVEFGACDGVRHSNTLLLESVYGWTGILSEPAHAWINGLVQNRSCHINRNIVYTESGKRLLFNQVEGEGADLSMIEGIANEDQHGEARKSGIKYEVETITLEGLLAMYGAPREIDYLSIDTEGSELDILSVFDFSRYDIKCISVEHNNTPQQDEIFKFLGSKGYTRKFSKLSQWDDWYVKRS